MSLSKILVADDEKPEREALLNALAANFGRELEYYEAEDGAGAARIAILRRVDIALMDIFLPEMSGIEAARSIRAQLPGTKIIFVTAYDRFEYAREALRLGALDYILKPFPEESVVAAVSLALEQIRARERLSALIPAVIPENVPVQEPDDTYDPQMAQLILYVREYLNRNYMNTVSLDYLSEMLKISPSYLSTQFKRYTHINFVDYLTNLRINEAFHLLLDPLRSTAEVAALVGYEDAGYFSRVFKKHTGLTPTQYRRQQIRASLNKDND